MKQDEVYFEKLDNGLEVYVLPMPNISNIYATFTTKFGSNVNEFVPSGKNKMIKVPDGIAHFLEHKLFEQEDGVDPFAFFSERGADCNANTSKEKTTYLFSGSTFFEENLNYLLDFVQSPYFTKENTEKEKGIIEQEINMYDDMPFWLMNDRAMANTFKFHPAKVPIAGSVKSIYKITKEDLYTCYNTFYHPANMILVVSGNVKQEEVFKIVKENQAKKEFSQAFKLNIKTYDEPDKVGVIKEIIKMDVAIPKFMINCKFNYQNLNLDLHTLVRYLNVFASASLGVTSLFNERLKNEEVITSDFGFDINFTDKHLVLSIIGESMNSNLVIKEILNYLPHASVSEEDFLSKQKRLKSSYLYASDNVYIVNDTLVNNIVLYNDGLANQYELIAKLNYKDFKNFIKKLNFKNYNYVIVEGKDK